MYITIEGPIGSGKTSLTNILVNNFQAQPVYEKFEKNPYLEKFYIDIEKYSFQTEMFFLIDRYNQMLETKKDYLENGQNVIADYNLAKSLIFAEKTLDKINFDKFLNIYNILVEDFAHPDLIIIIKTNLPTLKRHIKKRGRNYEQDIEDDYLLYLINKYDKYIEILSNNYPDKLLVVDGSKYDFVNNAEHNLEIINEVKKCFIKDVNEE